MGIERDRVLCFVNNRDGCLAVMESSERTWFPKPPAPPRRESCGPTIATHAARKPTTSHRRRGQDAILEEPSAERRTRPNPTIEPIAGEGMGKPRRGAESGSVHKPPRLRTDPAAQSSERHRLLRGGHRRDARGGLSPRPRQYPLAPNGRLRTARDPPGLCRHRQPDVQPGAADRVEPPRRHLEELGRAQADVRRASRHVVDLRGPARRRGAALLRWSRRCFARQHSARGAAPSHGEPQRSTA